jgi:hypothetical protein
MEQLFQRGLQLDIDGHRSTEIVNYGRYLGPEWKSWVRRAGSLALLTPFIPNLWQNVIIPKLIESKTFGAWSTGRGAGMDIGFGHRLYHLGFP